MAEMVAIQRPLRAAVIGTGKISEEHLRFLGTDPRVKLAAVCDLSPSLAKYAVERFGADKAYSDSNQMLAEVRPDVVHVLTPPGTHVRLVTDALKAGAHVVVEKPVASSHREFLELTSLADSCGKRIVEDHNYRFNEPVQAIEKFGPRRHAGRGSRGGCPHGAGDSQARQPIHGRQFAAPEPSFAGRRHS